MLKIANLRDALRHEGGVTRRLFLAYGAALGSIPLLARKVSANSRSTGELRRRWSSRRETHSVEPPNVAGPLSPLALYLLTLASCGKLLS